MHTPFSCIRKVRLFVETSQFNTQEFNQLLTISVAHGTCTYSIMHWVFVRRFQRKITGGPKLWSILQHKAVVGPLGKPTLMQMTDCLTHCFLPVSFGIVSKWLLDKRWRRRLILKQGIAYPTANWLTSHRWHWISLKWTRPITKNNKTALAPFSKMQSSTTPSPELPLTTESN